MFKTQHSADPFGNPKASFPMILRSLWPPSSLHPFLISQGKEEKLPYIHGFCWFHPSPFFNHIRWFLHIHLEDGRLLTMDHDHIPNATALISQPEDICLPLMTFLPSRFRPKWSPCSTSTSPRSSVIPGSFISLAKCYHLLLSSTFASSGLAIFYFGPREIPQLTGDYIVFEVCWL